MPLGCALAVQYPSFVLRGDEEATANQEERCASKGGLSFVLVGSLRCARAGHATRPSYARYGSRARPRSAFQQPITGGFLILPLANRWRYCAADRREVVLSPGSVHRHLDTRAGLKEEVGERHSCV